MKVRLLLRCYYFLSDHIFFFVEKCYLVLVHRINTHWCIYICTTFIIWFCGKNIEEQKNKCLGRLHVKWVSQGPKINCLELRRLSFNKQRSLDLPYLKARIQDCKAYWEWDSGLRVCMGCEMLQIPIGIMGWAKMWFGMTGLKYPEFPLVLKKRLELWVIGVLSEFYYM